MKRRKVKVDASFREGHAGLAVTGALGDHSKCVVADGSTHAEILALEWAIEIAHEQGATQVIFLTDCSSALKKFKCRDLVQDWVIAWLPRKKNINANQLARKARRDAILI